MVFDHPHEHGLQWAAIDSIAARIGCSGEALRNRVLQAERDRGRRAGLSTDERERIEALERENRGSCPSWWCSLASARKSVRARSTALERTGFLAGWSSAVAG